MSRGVLIFTHVTVLILNTFTHSTIWKCEIQINLVLRIDFVILKD